MDFKSLLKKGMSTYKEQQHKKAHKHSHGHHHDHDEHEHEASRRSRNTRVAGMKEAVTRSNPR